MVNVELKEEERNYIEQPLEIFSFGGGVQSMAMLMLIIDGILPKPDAIVMSDTGAEMPHTYALIEETVIPLCKKHGLNFVIVTAHEGKIDEYYMDRNMIPIVGIRSCTVKFKIRPIRRWARSIVGNGKGVVLARSWLGISTDEDRRIAVSDVQWMDLSFPLIDMNISRDDCERINKEHGVVAIC